MISIEVGELVVRGGHLISESALRQAIVAELERLVARHGWPSPGRRPPAMLPQRPAARQGDASALAGSIALRLYDALCGEGRAA